MQKFATADEVLSHVRRVVAYAEKGNPSRAKLAADLQYILERVAGAKFVTAKTVLNGHTDENSAYVVDDYPYGFKLRTKIRYWLETSNKGTRFVSQTLDPKKGRWNAPKKSTYCLLGGAMYLDDKGHVQWEGISEYSSAAQVQEFIKNYPSAKNPALKLWAAQKVKALMDLVEGKAQWRINGKPKPLTEEERGRYEDEAEQWFIVKTSL